MNTQFLKLIMAKMFREHAIQMGGEQARLFANMPLAEIAKLLDEMQARFRREGKNLKGEIVPALQPRLLPNKRN